MGGSPGLVVMVGTRETHVLKVVGSKPVPYTGWRFFTCICGENFNVCLKGLK